MPALADAVLPLIRTRTELVRLGAANAHGRQMHEAINILEQAIPNVDPAEAFRVADKALASAVTVVARADDSSGVIGLACRRLLALHPTLAEAAKVPASRLVPWMLKFQFDGKVDFFEIDPVAYAPALGAQGVADYRAALDEVRAGLPPEGETGRGHDPGAHTRFVLRHNDRRLAVLDRDVDAIIRTHSGDGRVAAWLEDTAEALEEIGEIDLALDWARRAVDFDKGYQSLAAARYWCKLLAEHRPGELVEARLYVFRRWPGSSTAAALHAAAGAEWPSVEAEVMTALRASPEDAVTFALTTLKDPALAWRLAHELGLDEARTWVALLDEYERIDPVATLPVHRRLVEAALEKAAPQNYRVAAARLARMRRLAAGTQEADGVEALIAELREAHRRRTRLLQELDKALGRESAVG